MFERFKPFSAPSNFYFKDPDTGYKYQRESRKALIEHISNYRLQNRLEPIEHIDTVLENYWCKQPENSGKCEPMKLARGIIPAIKGGILLLKSYLMKEKVSQEVADYRAEVCKECPHNLKAQLNPMHASQDAVALLSIGRSRSKHFEELGNCAVCSCPLKVKVWYGGSIELSRSQYEEMVKVQCWQPLSQQTKVK